MREMHKIKEMKVASLACHGFGGTEASIQRAGCMIEEACHDNVDLICFPEIFAWSQLGDEKKKFAEPIGGPVSSYMASQASKRRVNILTPVLEKSGDRIYNSMMLFDRQGAVSGVYRKTYPTDYEMAEGISPGPLDFEVFQSEFGPIGCCICFDLNFKDVIESISSQGAKLVIFPAMFQGVFLMQAWAKLYRMYFLSVLDSPSSALVDPLGQVIVNPWSHGPILSETLNLDYVVVHADYNAMKFPAIKAAYGSTVDIKYIQIESACMISSRHPNKSAMDICREFDLELEQDYYRRSAQMRMDKLAE